LGRPVIASEVGGLAYLVQDGLNGFHVPSRDPEALADRIFALLTDDDCRQAMGQEARRYAERFDWSRIVGRMFDVYHDLITVPLLAAPNC
jgi:D-inositol-3-phosphate glycosyltransferase